MITEKNTIKIRTEYTVEAKKEFVAPSRKTSNKLILGSLAFAVLFIVLIFIFYYYKEPDLAGLMYRVRPISCKPKK